MASPRFGHTLLHFWHFASLLRPIFATPTAQFEGTICVPVVFAVLCVTFASCNVSWERIFTTLQYFGICPGPFCNTLQCFLHRAFFAIPYSILGPGVANLQYLTAFQARAKTSGSDFAIPYSVSASPVLGVCYFCSTVHHFWPL